MSQCIHLGCKDEAWASESGQERSYFCVEHAWRAARGNLLFTPPQWAVFNKEGFIDHLVPTQCGYATGVPVIESFAVFPELVALRKTVYHPHYRTGWQNVCTNCGRPIFTGYRYCGKCRLAKGLPPDEKTQATIRCEHWRTAPAPGHVYLTNCEVDVPADRIVLCHGHKWCPSCRLYVLGIRKELRIREGYDF